MENKEKLAARSMMLVGSIDDDTLLFEIIQPAQAGVILDDLISSLYHVIMETVNKVPEEQKEETKKALHAHAVASFSLLMDQVHTSITPAVEQELREIANSLDVADK